MFIIVQGVLLQSEEQDVTDTIGTVLSFDTRDQCVEYITHQFNDDILNINEDNNVFTPSDDYSDWDGVICYKIFEF